MLQIKRTTAKDPPVTAPEEVIAPELIVLIERFPPVSVAVPSVRDPPVTAPERLK